MEGLAAAALVAGLLGGVHCVGMCGGVAGALAAGSRGSLPRRLAAFNFGRIGSYAIAGALAGAIGGLANAAGPESVLRTALFVAAQAMVVLIGLYVAGLSGAIVRFERLGAALWRRIEPLRRHFFPVDSDPRALGAGMVWGWIPCGLVYGMLPLAAVAGGPIQGAAVMAAFGVGTLPGLVLAGAAARGLASARREPWVRRVAGLTIVAVGVGGLARVPEVSALIATGWHCIV
jgi:sulfite exporter TauE/SafE